MSQVKDPKFFNKDGSLTPYAFACGYIQWASNTGKEIDHWENGKKMYCEGCVYHIQHYKDGKQIAWESRDTLAEARKYYNSIVIEQANFYVQKYKPLIDTCNTKDDYQRVYLRISSAIAGIILGRGFNQSLDEYLSDKPIKKGFNDWWMSIKDELHTKAF